VPLFVFTWQMVLLGLDLLSVFVRTLVVDEVIEVVSERYKEAVDVTEEA
jgi:hypothetical protein